MRFERARAWLAAAAALMACAATPAGAAEGRFAPLVDYHQHLASPAGVALLNRQDAMAPAVKLPADLDSVLRQLTEHWNEASAIEKLYRDDAIVFAARTDPGKPWLKGRRAAADYISSLYGRPYRLTPIGFDVAGNSARVAGYSTRGEAGQERHFGYFYLQLARAAGGDWQIAVDDRIFDSPPYYQRTIDGADLLQELDEAGIAQAVVLSDAYWFDAPSYRDKGASPAQVEAQVRAENDWTAAQAAASGGRLVAFCSFNPLADYALAELKQCAASGRFKGLKLHLQMSGVDLHKDSDVERLRTVFAEADRLRLAITVHAQTQKPYDSAAATNFIERVVTAAPHVPVIIAHLWGGGPFARDPLNVYVAAVESRRQAYANLYFDVAEAALVAGGDKQTLAAIAGAIRRIGPAHILFGSDAVGESTLPPEKAAAQFRSDVPLTAAEFARIASNRLPFLAAAGGTNEKVRHRR